MLDLGSCIDESFLDKPASFFEGETVLGCFYQQYFQDVDIFPSDINCTFKNANLDNVKIHPGMTLINCTTKRIRVQRDGQDWILDATGKPIEPVNKRIFEREGKNTDPRNIPAALIREEEKRADVYDAEFPGGVPAADSWFKTLPTTKSSRSQQSSVVTSREEFDAMQGNGPFDSTPTRNSEKEAELNAKDPSIDHVVLEGLVTYRTVEGEIWLFKDRAGVFHGD